LRPGGDPMQSSRQTEEVTQKHPKIENASNRKRVEVTEVTLSPGKLNAVRAAFKAGVTPSRIARQFGISQANVRKALASESDDRKQ
jgi:transposase-like protein